MRCPPLRELGHHFISDGDGTRRELHPVVGARVGPMASLLLETELLHRGIHLGGESGADKIEVEGDVLIARVDRDDAPAREHDAHAVPVERRADQRRDLQEGELLVDGAAQRGLPVRRGRRRLTK